MVADNIRKYRSERGISQQDFALMIDMDRSYFGAVERGERNISIDNLERIANGLNIAPSILLIGIEAGKAQELPDRSRS
ncbi:helix-turn-helix transcriptional regulator [Rhizobium sp. LjRoot30]|uniref:helix-turn-helix domain-containing protein n=1 Tax=Rhizobium sp. LjRoot30 TaxID=3342320 RepID=UPI003ECE9AED